MVSADGANHVHVLRAADAGHLGAESLGNLHGEGTEASRRAVDQDFLARLDPPLIAKQLECGGCGYSDRRGLLEREVGRLAHEMVRVAHAYSAKAPGHQPITSSPGRSSVTSLPTASTVPATSVPGMRLFGLGIPYAGRAM